MRRRREGWRRIVPVMLIGICLIGLVPSASCGRMRLCRPRSKTGPHRSWIVARRLGRTPITPSRRCRRRRRRSPAPHRSGCRGAGRTLRRQAGCPSTWRQRFSLPVSTRWISPRRPRRCGRRLPYTCRRRCSGCPTSTVALITSAMTAFSRTSSPGRTSAREGSRSSSAADRA